MRRLTRTLAWGSEDMAVSILNGSTGGNFCITGNDLDFYQIACVALGAL